MSNTPCYSPELDALKAMDVVKGPAVPLRVGDTIPEERRMDLYPFIRAGEEEGRQLYREVFKTNQLLRT